MIPVWITAIALIVIALLTKSRTYYVLAIAAVLNAIVDRYTTQQDQYLMLVYSSISFVAFAGVARFGDINITRNLIILTGFVFVSLLAEYSLVFDTMAFIESGLYEILITGLTIALLIGAGRGLDKNTTLHRPDNYWHSVFKHSLFNHRSSLQVIQNQKGKQ